MTATRTVCSESVRMMTNRTMLFPTALRVIYMHSGCSGEVRYAFSDIFHVQVCGFFYVNPITTHPGHYRMGRASAGYRARRGAHYR